MLKNKPLIAAPGSRRTTAALATLLAGGLALTACSGSDAPQTESGDSTTAAVENPYPMADVSGTVRGAGATSQKMFIEDTVGPALHPDGIELEYQATGSAKGKAAFVGKQADFASTDVPLSERATKDAQKRCEGNTAWHIPMVLSPVAVAYRLDGVDQEINLPARVVASIFAGNVTSWDDPRIAKANEGVKLPKTPIKVVYRGDQSGTSEIFQRFLAAATDGAWKPQGTSFPTGVGLGANGSAGVADHAASENGSITYTATPFTKPAPQLKAAKVDFGFGPVAPSSTSVTESLKSVKYQGKGKNMIVDADSLFADAAEGTYPLALTTYEVVCSKGYGEETRDKVKNVLYTMLANQQGDYADKGYVPLTGEMKTKVEEAVGAIGA